MKKSKEEKYATKKEGVEKVKERKESVIKIERERKKKKREKKRAHIFNAKLLNFKCNFIRWKNLISQRVTRTFVGTRSPDGREEK